MVLVAVIILALGIGVNTAMFGVVNAVLFPTLPVSDPAKLVNVYRNAGRSGVSGDATLSYPDYLDIRDHRGVFSGALAFSFFAAPVASRDRTDMTVAEAVSPNYCTVLGIAPVLGRSLNADDERLGRAVAMISDRIWRRGFGADSQIVGRTVRINGRPFEVVGVMGAAFQGVFQPSFLPTDVWIPAGEGLAWRGDDQRRRLEDRAETGFLVKARLAPGVSLQGAQAAMALLARQLDATFPPDAGGARRKFGLRPTSSVRGSENMEPLALRFSAVAMVAVGFVLLLACANVAHLVLVRGNQRHRELAIRRALGATRLRIARMLLIESVLLSAAAGAIGLTVAWVLFPLTELVAPQPIRGIPVTVVPALDPHVLLFAVGASFLSATLAGLVPAVRLSRTDVSRALAGEGIIHASAGGRYGSARVLLVTETSASLTLLLVLALLLRSYVGTERVVLAFDVDRTAAVGVEFGLHRYDEDRARRVIRRMLEQSRRLPGVESVGLTSALPVVGEVGEGVRVVAIEREGASITDPHESFAERNARIAAINPGYFHAIGLSVIYGRDFTDLDNLPSTRVAIINKTLARRFWPRGNAIGAGVLVYRGGRRTLEVVGIVQDTDAGQLDRGAGREYCWIYVPFAQQYSSGVYLVARAEREPASLVDPLRRMLRDIDPELAPAEIGTLRRMVRNHFYDVRTGTALMLAFGMIGLLLAAAGLYGVTASVVSRRTREIGVRIALGASPGVIVRHVLAESFAAVGVGLLIGIALAVVIGRVLRSLLFGISAYDPVAFVAAPLVLAAAALVACLGPARRASRVSPMTALRHE